MKGWKLFRTLGHMERMPKGWGCWRDDPEVRESHIVPLPLSVPLAVLVRLFWGLVWLGASQNRLHRQWEKGYRAGFLFGKRQYEEEQEGGK